MSHILVISRYSHSHIDVNVKSMGYVYGLRKMHACDQDILYNDSKR